MPQAAPDQGGVEFAETDQPVELRGLAVEAANLHGFPKPGGEFGLEVPQHSRVAAPRSDGGSHADNQTGESRRGECRRQQSEKEEYTAHLKHG